VSIQRHVLDAQWRVLTGQSVWALVACPLFCELLRSSAAQAAAPSARCVSWSDSWGQIDVYQPSRGDRGRRLFFWHNTSMGAELIAWSPLLPCARIDSEPRAFRREEVSRGGCQPKRNDAGLQDLSSPVSFAPPGFAGAGADLRHDHTGAWSLATRTASMCATASPTHEWRPSYARQACITLRERRNGRPPTRALESLRRGGRGAVPAPPRATASLGRY
jgi:hypothetical protein